MDGNMTDETIAQVVKAGLCTGCGTCIALCPEEAIKLTINEKKGIYVPELNEEKCNNCGICYEVCPGHEVDFKRLNFEIFGKEPENILIGKYLNCYIGHATDNDIRYNSASGGLVTQLLIFALEERIIDGALVTRMKKDKPLEPEPFIARTREEIIEASKSKYCPVPANIALKEIIESKEGEKFAVVGLPCHIHGIRKTEMINKKLKEKIVLHIGLFCGHTPNFIATKFLLQTISVHKEQVKGISYRGEGWPGGVSIMLKDGNKLFIPHSHPYAWGGIFGSVLFTPFRCLLCADGICELADISFGDAWLPELRKDDKIGRSIIVSKNRRGEEILQKMASSGIIALDSAYKEDVIQSQQSMLNFKKKNIGARTRVFKLFRKTTPSFNCQMISDAGYTSMLCALPFCLNNLLSQKAGVYFLLNHIPANLLIKYSTWITGVGHK
jgi:coenzyme F420 hydrogenase subunit beta